MSKRILLTGAGGYVGGAIARGLRRDGMTVLTAGRQPGCDIFLDLADPAAIAGLELPHGVDACVHAAATHEIGCARDPELAYVANVAATRALVRTLSRAGIGRLVYVSTFHVFGHPAGRLDERSQPIFANDYGLTHLQAEQVLQLAAARDSMGVDILRSANLFGCPSSWASFDRWTLAPFDFCRQAVNTGKIQLHGQGLAVRNYHSVDYLAAVTSAKLTADGQGVAHLSGWNWSVRELAQLAAHTASRLLGRQVPVLPGPARESATAPFEYASLHLAAEHGEKAGAMTRFFEDAITHLQEAGNEQNIDVRARVAVG